MIIGLFMKKKKKKNEETDSVSYSALRKRLRDQKLQVHAVLSPGSQSTGEPFYENHLKQGQLYHWYGQRISLKQYNLRLLHLLRLKLQKHQLQLLMSQHLLPLLLQHNRNTFLIAFSFKCSKTRGSMSLELRILQSTFTRRTHQRRRWQAINSVDVVVQWGSGRQNLVMEQVGCSGGPLGNALKVYRHLL